MVNKDCSGASVDILLATYNGEKYIEDLLASLQAQTFTNWQLIVRDDCSSDNTCSLIENFSTRHGKKVIFIDNLKQRLGPKKSFELLLKKSTSTYTMFCDQDDFWLPNKIQDSLKLLKSLEAKNPNKPALVFSDLIITDKKLKPIHSSFWKYSRINPENSSNTYKLLINNPAVGCTFLFNQAVKKLVLPFPEEARMHDWWTVLKVSESGAVDYIKQATILYRQHQKNSIGAEYINGSYLLNRVTKFKLTVSQNRSTYRMIKCLDKKYVLLKLIYFKLIIFFSKIYPKS